MVKIEKRSDLDLIDSHYLIKKYLKQQYNLICKNYDCTDLEQVGAIFYLQSKNDLEKYSAIGLSLPFDESIYETSDLLTLEDDNSKFKIFQAVYLLNNDIAITVIFNIDSLDKLTKSWLLEDCVERTVYF